MQQTLIAKMWELSGSPLEERGHDCYAAVLIMAINYHE